MSMAMNGALRFKARDRVFAEELVSTSIKVLACIIDIGVAGT
jgi:hypothetical protein